jgi:C-terminal processing protease CtpA/Prc
VVGDSSAAKAGLREGDIIASIDGVDVGRDPQVVIGRLSERVGRTTKIGLKREGANQMVEVQVGTRTETGYNVVELPNPTAEQLKVREAWLKRDK